MNRKMIALNLALAALAAVLGWQIRQRWIEGQNRERAIFTAAARKIAVLPPPALTQPKPVAAVEYIDVAQKMLFSKDRNPNVVIEVPPPKPKPPMPVLPAYFGQMAFGEPVVLLADEHGIQKSYHKGDKAGPFLIESFDSQTITFLWNDEEVVRKLNELVPKNAPPAQPAARAIASAPSSGSAPALKVLNTPSDDKSDGKAEKGLLGVDVGGGFYGCKGDDGTPSGSVVNGYKKVVAKGLFGETCHWEMVK